MLEIIILLTMSLGVYMLWSKGVQAPREQAAAPITGESFAISELQNPFLAQLQSEIEAALFPRPTDSVLKRHYDAMVASELRNRLATMTS